VKVFRHELLQEKCYTLSMTEQKKTRRGGVTWHGFIPDDDPRYQNAGWNYLSGKNQRPMPAKDDAQSEEPTAKDQENAP
jgi:hypothetical protein